MKAYAYLCIFESVDRVLWKACLEPIKKQYEPKYKDTVRLAKQYSVDNAFPSGFASSEDIKFFNEKYDEIFMKISDQLNMRKPKKENFIKIGVESNLITKEMADTYEKLKGVRDSIAHEPFGFVKDENAITKEELHENAKFLRQLFNYFTKDSQSNENKSEKVLEQYVKTLETIISKELYSDVFSELDF